MSGTHSLFGFALRTLVLLIAASVAWVGLMPYYNRVLTEVAQLLIHNGYALKSLGATILLDSPAVTISPLTIDSFNLQWGMLLLVALLLASDGILLKRRLILLSLAILGASLLQVTGLALLSYLTGWTYTIASPDDAARLTFSGFAVFWGLLPAIVAGAWSFAYWLPRLKANGNSTEGSKILHDPH